LHHGEAQSAGSGNDFIHKMKVSAKELLETFNCLRLISRKKWHSEEILAHTLDENKPINFHFCKKY
jgi:four helix bundle protein